MIPHCTLYAFDYADSESEIHFTTYITSQFDNIQPAKLQITKISNKIVEYDCDYADSESEIHFTTYITSQFDNIQPAKLQITKISNKIVEYDCDNQ